MPLSILPKDIESYELKDDEVKILITRYDPIRSEFLGIEYCVALVTVKNDPEDQFLTMDTTKTTLKCCFLQKS